MAALPWRLMTWNGSSWINAELRKWNGSSFDAINGYYWNGSSWVLLTDRTPPTSTYNEQYDAVDRASYQNNNSGSGLGSNYQGYYDGVYGIHKSMWLWDYGTIQAALAPRTAVYSNQLYMANQHTYYGSGGYAVTGTHANGSIPGSFNYNRYDSPGTIFFSKTEAKWTYVTNDMTQWFAEGSATGITLFANSYDAVYYGYYSTFAALYFTYEK